MLDRLKPLAVDYPHDYAYAAALEAYARNPDPDAEARFRSELASSNEWVREGAAKALAILNGIDDPLRAIFDSERELGFESLGEARRHYYAVSVYDAQVKNGGHAQFFVNPSGDIWPVAIDGLRAIRAVERAAVLQEATSLFGPGGPLTDNDERHEQLAALSEEGHRSLDRLDHRYAECGESVEVLLLLYAIGHKGEFSGNLSLGTF